MVLPPSNRNLHKCLPFHQMVLLSNSKKAAESPLFFPPSESYIIFLTKFSFSPVADELISRGRLPERMMTEAETGDELLTSSVYVGV